MELRVLQYFLAVTGEQNILRAAESLHLSQPTLSRQIRDMEEELGKQLFIRGSRSITLTEEGMILRKRAEEIMELVKKAEDEIALAEQPVAGDITVGAGETDALRLLVRAVQALRKEHPGVHFHVVSGDKCSVMENLDQGLIDFGVVFGDFDRTKYEYLGVPCPEHYGILMRKDDPLAEKSEIALEELWDKPLGYALAFEKIINTTGDSPLVFPPLLPAESDPHVRGVEEASGVHEGGREVPDKAAGAGRSIVCFWGI